jgi:transcription factor SPT20
MHAEKPPSPKTRKRTVAEMAADEAAAAEQERFMLILDERLSGLARGAKTADGNGQAPFEPRFERFQTLETIKLQHEENKRLEKLRKEEADRKQQQEAARNKLAADAEKREQEKARAAQMERQAAAQRQANLETQRRLQAQQVQQMGVPVQHAHPPNGLGPNGMAAQPQRFHNQQISQNQTSSPIIRNGTPQSHSSPTVNGMGMPMQQSTSSMGGSPPRPGSVVQQAHPMGAPAGHPNNVPMQQNRSQQSHAGTPRMPHSTPNVQATPLNRQMSQTPRMSQGSPQGTMPQTPSVMQMNSAQAAAFQQQQQQAANLQKMRMMQQMSGGAAIQGMGGMMQGPQPNQQQIMRKHTLFL